MRKTIWIFVLISSIKLLSLGIQAQKAEGQREANKFWSKYIASCGGTRYLKRGPSIFVELKGFNIQVDHEAVTQADRLNGVQAKGTSRYSASAYRTYSNSTWHKWGNGIPEDLRLSNIVRFQKVNGHWSFKGIGYFGNFSNAMVCSDLPWLKTKSQMETPTNSVQISDTHVFPIEEFSFWDSNTKITGPRFPQSTTTFINWQLLYTGTAFDYTLRNVEQYWYDKNGNQIFYADLANFSNDGRGKLFWGRGWAEPGQWGVGEYTVKVYLKKQLIAKKSFEIVPDDALPALIRTDGIYYYKTDTDIWIFKFFADGKVIEIDIRTTNFDDASNKAYSCYLNNQCKGLDVGQGSYRVQGSSSEFVTNGAFGRRKNFSISFRGKATSTALNLDWSNSDNISDSALFTFTTCPYRGC